LMTNDQFLVTSSNSETPLYHGAPKGNPPLQHH
jgi:hypothetical protein